MNERRASVRVLSFLLALCMVLGMVPMQVFADDGYTTVSGSFAYTGTSTTEYIFVATDRHENTSILATMINAMEAKIGENELDYLALGGDMVGSGDNHPTYKSSTVLSEITGATTSLSATNVDIVAGIHDMNVNDDAGIVLPYSGGGAQIYEGKNFYVYGVPESCISGAVSDVDPETEANDFVTWANGADIDKSKVIIVVSHYPLHVRREDNVGATYWYDALNEVAAGDDSTIDRNVAFFWGHNHTSESSADTAVYHVAPNGSITIEDGNNDTSTKHTIYFTYANAGYLKAKSSATLITITGNSITFDKYVSSSVSTSNSVTRVSSSAAVPKTLYVTGKDTYTVGDAIEAPKTVSVTDSSNTNTVITSGYSLSKILDADGNEVTLTDNVFTATGEYTLVYTCTVDGYTATVELPVSVSEVVQLNSIAVTTQPTKVVYQIGEELDTTGMVITGTYNNSTTAVLTGWYVSSVDMTTAGEKTVTVSYADDGITYKTTFTITVEEAPEVLTLQKIEVTTPPTKTEYLVSEELVLDGMVVTATFLNESNETVTQEIAYKPFSTSAVYGGYELDNFSMYVEKAHEMVVTYTYGEVTCTATTTINVWNEDFTDEATSVKVHVTGDYGVTAITVADSENTNVSTAISGVISGDNYKAYDISLVFDEGYSETTATKTVTLPIPEGVTNPMVFYVSDTGMVVDMKAADNGDGTVTFTTTHFSTYVVGDGITIETESGDAETTTTETVTTTTSTKGDGITVYKLVETPVSGKEYLIVNSNAGTGTAYGLNTSTTGYTVSFVSNDGSYYTEWDTTTNTGTLAEGTFVTTDTPYLWTAGGSWTFLNQSSTYLGYTRTESSGFLVTNYAYSLNPATTTCTWGLSDNQLSVSLADSSIGYNKTTFYLSGGSTWSMSESAASVYFYEPITVYPVTVNKTTEEVTVNHVYTAEGTDATAAAIVGKTVSLTSVLWHTQNSGTPEDITSLLTPTYEVVTTKGNPDVITSIEGNTATLSGVVGTAVIKVTYTSDGLTAWDEFIVTTTAPDHYSIELHYADLTEVAADATFDSTKTYYVFNSTTKVYEKVEITAFEDDVTYYTTPVIQGDEIDEVIALKGIEAGDRYPIWAVVKAYATSDDTTGTDLGELGDALIWTVSDTSIATIDTETGVLTFTGTNYGTFTVTVAYTGADGKVITDTVTISATESLYVVPGDGTNDFPEYPNQGAVRFDKTATAVGNFSETGIAMVELSMTGVPYSTGNKLDVMLMLDMSTSMDTEVADGVDRVDVTITAAKAFAKTILVNDDGTFTGNYICIKYFNGSTVYTTTTWMTVTSDTELNALYTLIDGLYTPTSTGTYYSVAMEDCYDTITARDAVSDNTQALVFMSDGGPTYYTYLNDSGTGTVVSDTDGSTFVDWFTLSDADSDGTNDTATPNSSFKTEYYSYKLKQAGYPVYTVGLGLSTNDTGPSSYTSLSSTIHEQITSYILSQMATSSSYFYNIADSDAVSSIGNVFSAIAASIKEAATDVVVEDKIGSNYTVNFSLPDGITSEATDGIEDFYIQVVEYVLDSTTHERTGTYTVLENFTFDGETGALISHTVDGVTCTDCGHVTTTDGVITKINGTYFDYEVKSDGEYLTWTADKLTSTELALQYFAYLDNSAGTDVEEQVAAGTYYTNEYATLTYTNVNNKVVQQEFPIPQMTWNGAQVSYVFYLVNEHGQPVNRAGKVVPFAEAVYVTDVYTYSIIWNDMEQSAGLEAKYLAENIVPDCYELYDSGASYNIHVYEKESVVNLNNHFVIGTGFTDFTTTDGVVYVNVCDDNTTYDDLAYTTYVFNNKSDGTKYSVAGAYVSDDADADLNETGMYYFCKSAAIEGATYTTAVDNDVTVYTVTSVGNGYQAVTGETQATVASITAAGGSTTGGTIIGEYIYYVDEEGNVYTIVQKSDGIETDKGFDFHNTTVAFAVVWKPELEPDVVVVDFGLDVVVDVIKNDSMAAGVVGVRTDAPSGVTINNGNYTAAKVTSADISIDGMKIGTASVENLNSVRFSFDKSNGMQFTEPVVFYYETDVNYYDSNNTLQTTSMYSSVTIIPATTVYYEDEYVVLNTYSNPTYVAVADGTEFDSAETYFTESDGIYTAVSISSFAEGVTYYTKKYTVTSGWDTNSVSASATQDVDRPGVSKISEAYDADNVYGYDSAYTSMSTFSMGNAAMTHVDTGSYATATFTFYGTGFDIISMTSTTTGTIVVNISGEDYNKNRIVDTYYGMEEDGTLSVNDPEAIYQVPVIKVEGLDYGKYTVTITASYMSYFDHNTTDAGYDFYLDAIRIYDPTGVASGATTNTTVSDAYVADGEGWPVYEELRNNVIEGSHYTVIENEDGTVSVTAASGEDNIGGAIFIDCNDKNVSIADYVSYGPNNELYLAPGQAIAFNVDATSAKDVQLGIKVGNGSSVSYTINGDSYTVSTATDMYYSILKYAEAGTVVIKNTSGGILSLTNIKVTYSEAPATETSLLSMDAESVGYSLMMLRATPAEDETTESETTTPETEEETTVPETEEETTESETTQPETEPETEPEVQVFVPGKLDVKLSASAVKVGNSVIVTVTTGKDVEALTVNGQAVTRYTENRWNGNRTWIVTVKAETVGSMSIDVVAYDAAGLASAPVTNTVNVTEKANNILEAIFGWIFR